jgi:hypothetical protein
MAEPLTAEDLATDEMGEGADAWRFDDTKLDDLEDFLRQVEQAEVEDVAPEQEKATPPPMSNNILQLIRDVNNELAEAQREVLVLRDENQQLREQDLKLRDRADNDEELADLYDAAEAAAQKTAEVIAQLEESKKEYFELKLASLKPPERHDRRSGGPAKRGTLAMGAKKLDCELIGGETLELSDRSQDGHCHVSKISLSHIMEVKTVDSPKNSFCVTTQGGSYVMTAGTESEAKSWVRSVQVSIKVAKAKAAAKES